MSTFKPKRDEKKVTTGAEVQAIKLPWENNETSSRSSAFTDHGTATIGRMRTQNTVEKEAIEMMLTLEREKQLEKEREERSKQLAHEEVGVKNYSAAATTNTHHLGPKPAASKDNHDVSSFHGLGTPAAATTDSYTPSASHSTSNLRQEFYSGEASQQSGSNSATSPAANIDVTMKLILKRKRLSAWSTKRGVVELLEFSIDVTSNIYSTFGCIVTLNADKCTVTIDGGRVTEAGRWLEHKVALIKVDQNFKTSAFIAAMRLRDVAKKVESKLKVIPASFDLTDNTFVVYTWHEEDLRKALLAIYSVVAERQVEVYEFANNSRSEQLFYSQLDDSTSYFADSVCIQVDKSNRQMYRMVGLVRHVKLIYESFLPYRRHKIVRSVTPAQAELLQAFGSNSFDSADDCRMTLSTDSEMVVYCTQRVEAEVIQECDSILNQIVTVICKISRTTDDIDMILLTHRLNGIENDNKVVIKYDQSKDRNDRESVSEQMFLCSSCCVDICDKTQLRLVDADITDLSVDAIVSTIDEHGTPNTELAQYIAAKGGPAIADKLKQKVTCKLSSGAVVMCDGGQLPCRNIIHVQYPPAQLTITHDDYLSFDESKALKCCIVNILAICKDPKYQLNAIAMPVIGSYSNKQKLKDCMRYMARALHKCVDVIKSLSVRYIVLVAQGTDNFKLFHDRLHLVLAADPILKFNIVDIDKCFTINDCCVSLVTGDLWNMKCQVDAIVVAITRDKDLTYGGLATSIHRKDPNIQRLLQASKWPDEATGSGVIVCESNILASRYVFFIHLLKYTEPNAEQHFRGAINACLQQAAKQGIKSIAFPILGAGELNYSDDFVATCMTTLIERFCQDQPGKCTSIRIVRHRDTEAIAFFCKFKSLAQKFGDSCLLHKKANSQTRLSGQTSAESTADVLQFNITGFRLQSVVNARESILQVFAGKSGYPGKTEYLRGVADAAGYHDDVQHSRNVVIGKANNGGKSPVSNNTDEKWEEFIPGVQATLEKDYSMGCDYSEWLGAGPNERRHIVNFKTQPMTYMVKCGETMELSTVVERRVNDASSGTFVTRGADDRLTSTIEDEDARTSDDSTDDKDNNTRTGNLQIGRSLTRQLSHSPSPLTVETSDNPHEDYSHTTTTQHNANVRPSANRKKNNGQQQDDNTAMYQPAHERQSSTHNLDPMDYKPTYVNTAPQNYMPSANRQNRSNLSYQSSDSVELLSSSLLRQLSKDSQVKIKTTDNVAMTTKYTWDSNIPSYWAPMDGSSVKTVVLHPTDSEYQLVAGTFLASLGNTLVTVIQIERIQNLVLHSKYMHNKELMDKTNSQTTKNERQLWHGITVQMTPHGPVPIKAINSWGFNRSYAASSSGRATYGNGTYFAVEARKSLYYSKPVVNGHRHMYWCRVLTGEYTRGRADMVAPPVKISDTYHFYNSVVDIVESPTMFVIFEDGHAYPEYLITFK